MCTAPGRRRIVCGYPLRRIVCCYPSGPNPRGQLQLPEFKHHALSVTRFQGSIERRNARSSNERQNAQNALWVTGSLAHWSAGTPMRQRSSDIALVPAPLPHRGFFSCLTRGARGAARGAPTPAVQEPTRYPLGELELELRNACRRSRAPCPPKPRFGGHTHAHAPRSAPFTRHSLCYIPRGLTNLRRRKSLRQTPTPAQVLREEEVGKGGCVWP